MAYFSKTKYLGRVRFLGAVGDRDIGLASQSVSSLAMNFDGPFGEDHGGLTRAACVRVSMLYEKGTEIRNFRQVSVLSFEELEWVAQQSGLNSINPEWIGANIVIEGIPNFSALPPSSRLRFPSGAVVQVDVENWPCTDMAIVVEANSNAQAKDVKAAFRHHRGVVGSVEREGIIHLDDEVELFTPDWRGWDG